MKKLLLALPLVAGVSWAGTTYYSGAQTEAAYNRLLEQINAKSNEMFVLKSTEYKAGIMESTAITEVASTEKSGEDIRFLLKHQINHSLVSVAPQNPRFGAASIITTLLVDDSYSADAKKFMESFETGEPFIATTEVAVDGATDSEIKINAVDHSEDDVIFKNSGAIINLATTASGDVTGNGVNDLFVVSEGDNKKMEMSNLAMKFDMKKLPGEDNISPYLHDINFEASVDEGHFVDAGEQVGKVKGITYVINQKLSADEPSAIFNMGVESLEVEAIPLKSLDFGVALTGFSMTEMLANKSFYQELQNARDPGEYLFTGKGLEIMRATFKPDTKMALKMDAKSSDGDGNAAIDLWFAGNGSDDGYTGMATAGDLAKAIAGTAVADIDKSVIMMTPLGGMLEHPMAQAYLTVGEDNVSLNATLEALVLKLNDQIIPLELMAGDMLSVPLEALLEM